MTGEIKQCNHGWCACQGGKGITISKPEKKPKKPKPEKK